jgi:phosphatidylglycerol:prolipoprotein diacylglycerol transferase
VKPILLRAFGYQVAAAPTFAGLAALTAFLYLRSRRAALALNDDDFWTLIAFLAAGTLLGSVAFYALVYGGGLSANVAFWRTNDGIQGGSFVGALAGSIVAAVLFCRMKGRPFAPVGDALGAAAPLGLVVMRVGCFLNGCCYGRPTGKFWGVIFSGPCAVPENLRGVPLHPTQLYESAGGLLIFLAVDRLNRRRSGLGLWTALGLYGALRFGVDFLRAGDPGVYEPLGFTVAQWFGAAAVAAATIRWTRRQAAA